MGIGRTHVASRRHGIANAPPVIRLTAEAPTASRRSQIATFTSSIAAMSIAATRHITPQGIRPPFARYSYGVEIPAGHRILVCSGQLGVAPDDHVPATIEDQTHLCFRNIGAVLEAASFSFADVVRINSFVVSREHLKGYMSVRDLYISDPPPASTLMIVSGFSRPEFLVEVEVIAAAP
jgi:enamine deaminase RidA (YjgF/YER057c/UK114 family)